MTIWNERYRTLITYLDCALTDKPYKECLHTFKNSIAKDPVDFLEGQMYYLSDGGYSRLCWNTLKPEGGVYVASESLKEVKEAFSRCKELAEDLNTFLREVIETEESERVKPFSHKLKISYKGFDGKMEGMLVTILTRLCGYDLEGSEYDCQKDDRELIFTK